MVEMKRFLVAACFLSVGVAAWAEDAPAVAARSYWSTAPSPLRAAMRARGLAAGTPAVIPAVVAVPAAVAAEDDKTQPIFIFSESLVFARLSLRYIAGFIHAQLQ